MTVLDTSAVVDYLLGSGVASDVEWLVRQGPVTAPDVLVFEVLAVLRRAEFRGWLRDDRAASAVHDLGDLSLKLVPSLPLRVRAWDLRRNMTSADALFVALAERRGEPLATKDRALAQTAAAHADVDVLMLSS